MACKTLQGKYAEKLNEKINELYNKLDAQDEIIEQQIAIINEQKKRINKAIEYIEEKWKEPEWWDTDFMICINILKGGSGTLKEILGDKE